MVPVDQINAQLASLRAQRFKQQREHASNCIERGTSDIAEGFFTLYQIRVQETYKAEYATWDKFIHEFKEEVHYASRTLIYDMVRVIRRLKSLQGEDGDALVNDEEILQALRTPMVIRDALNKCGRWTRGGGFEGLVDGVEAPILPKLNPSDAEVMALIVLDALELERGEARKFISQKVGEPQIWAKLVETDAVAGIEIIDEDEEQTFNFFMKGALTSRARDYLERAFRARFEERG